MYKFHKRNPVSSISASCLSYIKLLILAIIILALFTTTSLPAQVTAVVDKSHVGTTTIELTTNTASTVMKTIFENPAWEKISKVQQFLKDASTIISAIIKNMKMTRELVEIETEIFELLGDTYETMHEVEYFPDKWVYRKAATELYYEKLKLFEIFDLAEQQNKGIIDDEGRIQLIKEVYIKAKEIRSAMRIINRRARKQSALYRRAKKEIEVFGKLFQ